MAVNVINAQLLSRMFLAGAKALEADKARINELNVFPVPDGDTGTNMTMTIMSAAREVADMGEVSEMKPLCKAISGGSLRGARGNSGVILSQLLRGFTKRCRDEQEIDALILKEAFAKAVETAYKAVMKPTEGTILTVARGISEKATELVNGGCTDLEEILTSSLEHGKVVLDQTPEMLPVLKQAGVVDSGGSGLIVAMQGAVDLFLGKEMDLTISDEPILKADDEKALKAEEKKKKITSNIYCTELKIHLHKSFNFKVEMDVRNFLNSIGELLEAKIEGEEVLIHLHTDDPGLVLQKALKYGELTDVVVKNRNLEDFHEKEGSAGEVPVAPAISEPRKAFGFIAVSAGDGLSEIFRSLGVDYVIEGGQTMNPSTADILNAVDKVNADTVFVFPNNKNIIMAANQAAELMTEKTLLVIPTKTVPQGITAAINFSEAMSPDENEQAMMEAISRVKTGEITYAVRDTEIDDKKISKDDFMGIGDKGILAVGKDRKQVVLDMVKAMVDEDSELISVYYGADIDEATAEGLRDELAGTYSKLDIELQCGGQPIYYYIISVE